MILLFLLYFILKTNLVPNTFIPLGIEEYRTVFQVDLDYNKWYSFKTTLHYLLASFPGHERALASVVGSLGVSDLAKNVV
jgi:hypothetical protein